MDYTIDIIDTIKDVFTTKIEFAEKGSIALAWNGGDEKDSQNIVGSSLNFTMEVHTGESVDGFFGFLFSGSETRYRIRLYKSDSNKTIWTGFLLPDKFAEPYTNGTYYTEFTATDGLGRLKGKYLDDVYYEEEFSVIQYFTQLLKLTGLELSLSLSAAIENVQEKDYNNVYLDGAWFLDKDLKKDAYTILQEILSSMLCVVYQADDQWYIEGFNQRHLKNVQYYNYDADGVFVDKSNTARLVKPFRGLDTPFIDVVPPYNAITVSHARVPQALPETIVQEKNDGWAIGQGVEGDIHPTYWFGNGGYYAKAKAPEYKVVLPTLSAAAFDDTKYINLKDKIYVNQYDKLVFSAKFTAATSARVDDDVTLNGLKLSFYLDDDVLYAVEKSFDDDELEIKFDLYVNRVGLLDLRIWQPFFDAAVLDDEFAEYITISELKMEVIGFNDTDVDRTLGNEDFSAKKDMETVFADDAAGYSKAFRFAKLKENSNEYNEIDVPVLYGRTFLGEHFSIVSLFGANLIADNIDSVYHNNTLLTGLEVVYNHLEGEEMVIKTHALIDSGSFTVRKHRLKEHNGNRNFWEQWTDKMYPVERDRYITAVGKVLRRLFVAAHERVEATLDMAVKFNDLIGFDYVLPANYFITNLVWRIDAGETDVVLMKSIYANEIIDVGTENIPPIVNAGDDVLLDADFGTYDPVFGYPKVWHNTASAYDPDGFIASYLWEVVDGDANAVFSGKTSLAPTLTRFNGDYLTLRLTVTDNDGATASDTVTFFKQAEYSLELTDTVDFRSNQSAQMQGIYKSDISFDPNLSPSTVITIKGTYSLEVIEMLQSYRTNLVFTITKNGTRIFYENLVTVKQTGLKEGDFEFNYINGDDVEIQLNVVSEMLGAFSNIKEFRGQYEINGTVFQSGGGVIDGYPVGRDLHYKGNSWLT